MKKKLLSALLSTMLLLVTAACSGGSNAPTQVSPSQRPTDSAPSAQTPTAPDPAPPTTTEDWPEIPESAWEYQYSAEYGGIEITKYNPVSNILRVRIPDTFDGLPVVSIGTRVFEKVGAVEVYLPSTVVNIANFAFMDSAITSIAFPEGLLKIGNRAFRDCVGLTSVILPDSLLELDGESVFSGCTGLTSVTIGSGLKRIETTTFKGCTSLADISIPSTVQYVAHSAFHDTAFWFSQPDGWVYLDSWLLGYKTEDEQESPVVSDADILVQDGTMGIASGAFFYILLSGETNYSATPFRLRLPDSVIFFSIGDMRRMETITYRGVVYERYQDSFPDEFYTLFQD